MTMTNAEWMIQNGYKFINLRAFDADNANRAYKIGLRMEDYTWKWIGEVNKVYNDRSTAVFTWLDTAVFTWLDMEHVEPILDDVERKYLSAVISPFRDSVRGIEKAENLPYEMICIDTKYRYMVFPPFDKGTMYKGMKTGWRYTLEELGL